MPVNFIERLKDYDEDCCWQYHIRLKNYEEDVGEIGLTEEEIKKLRVSDFHFEFVEDRKERTKMTNFIKRHEWLGTLSQYTTHWFACYYKETLAGVILFNLPNTFSKMMGEGTKEIERLISRGACISWSPKNLASSFLMWCIGYMVKNTRYRLFTAYSDPSARELGTIYQACNFYYIGQKSGTLLKFVSPYTGKIVSDRYFRQKTSYKKYAKEMGIEWGKDWNHSKGMNWHNMPKETELKLRACAKEKQKLSKKIESPAKHKYAYVLGITKKETKELRKEFEKRNTTYPYPKERIL